MIDIDGMGIALNTGKMRENPNIGENKMRDLSVGDKIKLNTASGHDDGICTVTKTRSFKTKGQRVYIKSQYGYGFMMWLKDMNYERI